MYVGAHDMWRSTSGLHKPYCTFRMQKHTSTGSPASSAGLVLLSLPWASYSRHHSPAEMCICEFVFIFYLSLGKRRRYTKATFQATLKHLDATPVSAQALSAESLYHFLDLTYQQVLCWQRENNSPENLRSTHPKCTRTNTNSPALWRGIMFTRNPVLSLIIFSSPRVGEVEMELVMGKDKSRPLEELLHAMKDLLLSLTERRVPALPLGSGGFVQPVKFSPSLLPVLIYSLHRLVPAKSLHILTHPHIVHILRSGVGPIYCAPLFFRPSVSCLLSARHSTLPLLYFSW